MKDKLIKRIEYRITYTNGNIDHVSFREATKMIANPPLDVGMIERVIRWWHDDGSLEKEESETLYGKGEEEIWFEYSQLSKKDKDRIAQSHRPRPYSGFLWLVDKKGSLILTAQGEVYMAKVKELGAYQRRILYE